MGGAQGKELIKEYRSKKGSLTASKDDRAIRRIFRTYDKDADGKLNRAEALDYVKDLLEAAGLAKQIWDDAVQADDPKAYFNDVVAGILDEINKKNKDLLELEDIVKMTSTSMKLQDILNDVSERLEENWRVEMFKKALQEDISDLQETYQSNTLIKEIKYDEKTHRLGVVVDGSGVRATLSIEIPDDFPFGHIKARVKFNEDALEVEQVDSLEALEKEVSKMTKQSDIALGDVIEAFINGFTKKFQIAVQAEAEKKKKKQQSAWRTQSRDATSVREIHVSVTKPIDTDIKEAALLFGSQSVSQTGTTDTLRLRFDAAPLDPEIATILGIKDQSKEYAAVTVAFHANYLHIEYAPLVKPVKKTKTTLTASQSASSMQVNLNERFSEVMATVAQQYLQKRWPSVAHPEKWELNSMMNSKSSSLKKKTLKIAEHEHVHRALILAQYDAEFARELLEAALQGKGKEADDDSEEEEAPAPKSESSSSSSTTLPPPVDIPLTIKNVQPTDLPESAGYVDAATPWMSKPGVHFSCDQCGARIYSVAWICTQCVDYDLCDACHSAGWQTYAKGHQYSHPMVPLRYQSANNRYRAVDPESTTVESYVLMSRPNQCTRPGVFGDNAVIPVALSSQVQRSGPSFDSSSADASSMIAEIKGVTSATAAQQKRLEDIINRGCSQLAMSEALLMKRMNAHEALHLYLDAGGAIENVEALEVLERKHDPDRLSNLNHVNIILETLAYVTQRLKRLRGFCLMCGQRIVLDLPAGAASTGPSYITSGKKMLCCTKATCQFQHVEMKHMLGVPIEIVPASISGDIINNEDLVDLFICLAYSATGSGAQNKEKVFDPAPPFITGSNRFEKIHSLVNNIPKVSSMRQHAEDGEAQLRRFLNGISDGIYPFLHWLLHVKRGVMVKIPPKRRIPEFKTDHQFVMLAGTDPERRVQFNEWRAQYGSYFAFHGSAAENWHSILRNGLRNLSGTDLQRNGAAYGSGVYMAKDSSTSFSYSRVGSNWGHSKFGTSSLLCLAIAEVCKGPGVPLVPNPYYVVREDKYIMTRFFLFYPGNSHENVLADNLGLARYFDDDPKASKEKPPAHLYNKEPL